MRDLFACLCIWLGPGLRRTLRSAHQRARAWFAALAEPAPRPVLPARPRYDRGPLPARLRAQCEPLDEDETLVRPYAAADEQEGADEPTQIDTEQITADVQAAHHLFEATPSSVHVIEMSKRLRLHLVALLPHARAALDTLPKGGPHTPHGQLTAGIDYACWHLQARVRDSTDAACHMFRLALAVNGLLPDHERVMTEKKAQPPLAHLPSARRWSATATTADAKRAAARQVAPLEMST